MGLGKTLTMLALIAGSIDRFRDINKTDIKERFSESMSVKNSSSTTLIITPLSST